MIDTTSIIAHWPDDRIGSMLGNAEFKRPLVKPEILGLLKIGRVRFVIADIGNPLQPVSPQTCHDFWKQDVKHHVCDVPHEQCYPSDFDDDYCYFASEWGDGSSIPIVLLFRNH